MSRVPYVNARHTKRRSDCESGEWREKRLKAFGEVLEEEKKNEQEKTCNGNSSLVEEVVCEISVEFGQVGLERNWISIAESSC